MIAHARESDPYTSHEAAADATRRHPDTTAAGIVKDVFERRGLGIDMTDEQIHNWAKFYYNGECPSDSRLRHGRLLLTKLGMLKCVTKKPTSNGSMARSWCLANAR